jgi:hydrogenase maturation protein HypF
MPVAASARVPLAADQARARLTIRGAVQGVGFRPSIYRLANELGLAGWVNNSPQGVFIEVEGPRQVVEEFILRIGPQKPPRSSIQSLEATWLDPIGYDHFEIRPSELAGPITALVLPDIATCPDCLRELFDPADRRHFYPFTNCTNCGPRFSIIEALPYDRPNTSMKRFTMCPRCQAEYENPLDRRFHAQPNACPDCGPHLELWDREGRCLQSHRDALFNAVEAIRYGAIVGVKGLGGFHLVAAAGSERTVRRLRELKQREEKPFALMFPSLAAVEPLCDVSPFEERLLRSPEAPIVLLHRKPERVALCGRQPAVARAVAPGNPCLGVMLPYTPLHHLLLHALGVPVVATSGNLADEPICTDEHEALQRLGRIADLFLVHNRPIVRHVDDSIVRVVAGRELVLRRARGFAPLPIGLPRTAPTTLAVGAHLKNSVALSVGQQVFVSQHIGDLETTAAFSAFCNVATDLQKLYQATPAVVACDAHPDYLSTKFAHESGKPVLSVQHHLAHVLSCMAENQLEGPLLGVSWDGTGYGLDGTVWGGEFFHVVAPAEREDGYLAGSEERRGAAPLAAVPCQRIAHFRTFRLPGGDKAVREPRRSALGLLYELFGPAVIKMVDLPPIQAFAPDEIRLLCQMLDCKLNCPRTSSVGRLFDAVAALAGLRQETHFEGQSAMELEFALVNATTDAAYPIAVTKPGASDLGRAGPANKSAIRHSQSAILLDWAPMIHAALADLRRAVPAAEIAAKFHHGLVEAIVAVARAVEEERVVLTGGCFQNKYLTERAVQRLKEEGFRPYWHQRIPPNDGGIALGQVMAVARSSPTPPSG